MHERGIVQDLVNCVREKARASGESTRVEKVYIRLGKAMELTEDSLKFWFEDLSRGTELEGAGLEISLIDGGGIFVDAFDVA
jgi:Zn finger protein HypA/HybF involved in hydrogenase expression